MAGLIRPSGDTSGHDDTLAVGGVEDLQRRRRESRLKLFGSAEFDEESFIAEQVLKDGNLKLSVSRHACNCLRFHAGEVYETLQTARVLSQEGQRLERNGLRAICIHGRFCHLLCE